MIKKILLVIGLSFMLMCGFEDVSALELSSDNFINNSGVVMTQQEIENLKKLGFNDFDINNMNQITFDENKNLIGEVVAVTTKYYKTETIMPNNSSSVMTYNSAVTPITRSVEITKEEYDNSDNTISTFASAVVNTEYKEMTTSIVAVNGRYRYRNVVRWKKLPVWQTVDIISIGFDEKVYGVSSTKRLNAYYTFDNSCGLNVTTNGVWQLNSTGYGVTFDWPEKDNISASSEGFYVDMYFEVDKNTTDTINVLNAYGNYRHGKGNFTASGVSVGVSISYFIGLSVNFEDSFDTISTAQATYTGINW